MIISPADAFNGCFEFAGAYMVSLNVRAILRDKMIRGIHWAPTFFFAGWGVWNCYYYPSLGQWCSFAGGVTLTLVNATWLGLMWVYRHG